MQREHIWGSSVSGSWLTPAWCRSEGENNPWQYADHARWTERGYVHPVFSGRKMVWEPREAKPQKKSHTDTGTKSHSHQHTHQRPPWVCPHVSDMQTRAEHTHLRIQRSVQDIDACAQVHTVLGASGNLAQKWGPGEPVSSGMTHSRQFPLAGLQCWATCQQHTGQTDTSHCWEAARAAFSSN